MAMIERKVASVAWDKPGIEIVGKLLGVAAVKFRDGGTNWRYKVRDREGVIVIFAGATQLNDLLSRDDVGKQIYVQYTGEDNTRQMTGDKNRPKTFKVMVDDAPVAAAAGDPGITDDDIPF